MRLTLPLAFFITTSQAAQPDNTNSLENDRLKLDHQASAVRAAATTFCTEVHREPIAGLPSTEQLRRLSPLITPELKSIFERADAIQKQLMRKHPDDKPMWIEGDLFSSMFEGATSWEIEKVIVAPTIDPLVKLKQHHVEPNQKPVTWSDTLIFKQHGERWLLDDIRMGGNWEFKSGHSLRSMLPGGGREGEDHESLDEQWKLTFTRDGGKTTRVTVQSTTHESKPAVLFGKNSKEVSLTPVWVVWNPECDKLALRIGDDAHFSHTQVFELKDGAWLPLTIPEIHATERKTMRENKFAEHETFIDADHWQDSNTLVVRYFTDWSDGSDGDGYSELVTVRFDARGNGTVVDAKDMPDND